MTTLPPSPIAPLSKRAWAFIIDALIVGGIAIVCGLIVAGLAFAAAAQGNEGLLLVASIFGVLTWLIVLGWMVVYLLMLGGERGSIGMRTQRIRLIRQADERPLGFGYAVLRYVVFAATASIYVGYFSPLFDKSGRNQGWHDMVAKSLMVAAGPSAAGTAAASAAPAYAAPSVAAPSLAPVLPAAAPVIDALAPAEPLGRSASPQLPVPPQAPSFAPVAPEMPAPDETVLAHPVSTPPADGVIAFVPGITQDAPAVRTPEPAPATPVPPAVATPVPPVVASPAMPPAAVHPSSADEDIESTRISVPGHRLVFTWDDGTRIEVSRRTVFGRNPAPEDGAAVVSVRDETLSLSKTHFEAEAEASGGWVRDRHSTNGMTIIRGGERIDCPAGERVRVRLGDAIEIGDRIVTVGGYV